MSSQKVVSIYRHLVKGLRQEKIQSAEIKKNGLLGDRAFAFQFLDTDISLPEETQSWISKFNLAVQHDWPTLSQITPSWDASTATLTLKTLNANPKSINACVNDPADRKKLSDFVHAFLQHQLPFEKARKAIASPLRLIGNSKLSTRFTDGDKGPISLALTESLEDLELKTQKTIDERRFRLNLFLRGAPAWSELGWSGKTLKIGECELLIYKPIGRCPNIDVHQDTGDRCPEIFPLLKQINGHSLFGIKAEIIKEGPLHEGDPWELI